MPRTTLTRSRIAALKPRARAYDIRDGKLPGFGVRLMPSGAKRYFIHSQHNGKRVWQIVGDTDALDVDEARSRATTMQAALRRGAEIPSSDGDALFETVARTAFRRHERLWKAGTFKVNSSYLDNHILPHFRGCPIAEIDHTDVRRWFASLRATPAAADRSLPVLSVIMREAERMGLRPEGSNPCRGVRRNRRKGRERFLSEDEIRRLSAILKAHADSRPQEVAFIRLLLLTGSRKSELLTLRWTDYREGHLHLRDSKTGPRTVWLSQPARNILDSLERNGAWVFGSSRNHRPRSRSWPETLWFRVRAEAGLADVRLPAPEQRRERGPGAARLRDRSLERQRPLLKGDRLTWIDDEGRHDMIVDNAACPDASGRIASLVLCPVEAARAGRPGLIMPSSVAALARNPSCGRAAWVEESLRAREIERQFPATDATFSLR